MFPIERTTILNSIDREIVGRNVTRDNINVSHLINADSIETIFRTTWEMFWGKFISFGTFSAGLL